MRAVVQLCSFPNKILAVYVPRILPELSKLLILAIWFTWKYYKRTTTKSKYMSVINNKSLRFCYNKKTKLEECGICLSELVEGEEGREIVECKHVFHTHCLDKWLKGYAATCPMCRCLVVPDEGILQEYERMKVEEEDNWIEKELSLILLNAFDGGICIKGK